LAGIYIHIPFCKQACHYCDFHFSTNLQSKNDLLLAISKEIILQKDYLAGDVIETIYFGGGTPSLLSSKEISQITQTIHAEFKVTSNPEITLEANPDDLSFEKLSDLSAANINRLSIGVQSFDDNHLTYLNRAHNSQEALNCIADARKVGIDNVSIDLIYAIPSEGHDIWKKDLAQAIALKPTHISSYCLTIEESTAFGNWLKRGKIKSINDEHAAQQFEILLSTLKTHGYEQYEVSNYCLPNQYSKHNSNYWRQEKYLGVGPSAHSYNGTHRQFNISNNKKYIDALNKNSIPFTLDSLSHKDHINEYLLTTLRTKWGASLDKLNNTYQHDLRSVNKVYIDELLEQQLVKIENSALILTDQGKLFADKIASDLFLV
jgi:oxygen-independent coproporphyrinogen-3 oxidase